MPDTSKKMLKILIVEDDFVSRSVLIEHLSSFGICDTAVNGHEAVTAFTKALEQKLPYDLICLDIMMPGMDGQETLREVRRIEENHGIVGLDGVKVIMTTALDDFQNIMMAFRSQCESYLVKPIEKAKLLNQLRGLSLIEGSTGQS